MRKAELVSAIASRADLSREQAGQILECMLEQIVGAMGRRDHLTLVGFGTFQPRHRGARAGKNPQTGEPVTIGASNTVSFRPGKALREQVQQAAVPVPLRPALHGARPGSAVVLQSPAG